MNVHKINRIDLSMDTLAYDGDPPTVLGIHFEEDEDHELLDPESVNPYYEEVESEDHGYWYGYNTTEEYQEPLSVFLMEYRRAYADNLSFFPEELNVLVTTDGTREMLLKDFLLSIKDDVLSGKY